MFNREYERINAKMYLENLIIIKNKEKKIWNVIVYLDC